MNTWNVLKRLSDAGGVCGDEGDVSKKIKDELKSIGAEFTADTMGNVVVYIKGREQRKKIMLYSHIDESGLVINNIDENGFLNFYTVGNVHAKDIASQEVYINGRKTLKGLLGLRPPHILSQEERNAEVTLNEMNIDAGMKKDEVSKYVSVGDTAYIKRQGIMLKSGIVSGKALGDRAGSEVLLSCIENLAKCELDSDIYFVFGVQHYNNNAGANKITESIRPDAAFVIDSCDAKTRENKKPYQECGCGTVIYKGPTSNPYMTEDIISFAKKNNIKYQILASSGKNPMDAWAIQTAAGGTPLSIILVPSAYRYSTLEKMSISDVDETSKLVSQYIKEFDSKKRGEFLCW